jgi:hypothetical protein
MTAFQDKIFVFSGATLEQALDDWLEDQVAAYPHQEERIRIACAAMRDFFDAPQIEQYKMRLRSRTTASGSEW